MHGGTEKLFALLRDNVGGPSTKTFRSGRWHVVQAYRTSANADGKSANTEEISSNPESRSTIVAMSGPREIAMQRKGQFEFEYHHGRRWWRLVIPSWVLRWVALLLLAGQGGGAIWWATSDIIRAASLL